MWSDAVGQQSWTSRQHLNERRKRVPRGNPGRVRVWLGRGLPEDRLSAEAWCRLSECRANARLGGSPSGSTPLSTLMSGEVVQFAEWFGGPEALEPREAPVPPVLSRTVEKGGCVTTTTTAVCRSPTASSRRNRYTSDGDVRAEEHDAVPWQGEVFAGVGGDVGGGDEKAFPPGSHTGLVSDV